MLKRTLFDTIINSEKEGFINVIYGPRRVGKTVLLNQIIAHYSELKHINFNGDNVETRELLSSTSETLLTRSIKDYDLVTIDEAQRIENIGLSLKIIIDTFPHKKIFVTGSSSIDIAKGLKESLTGRTIKHKLFPLSTEEITTQLHDFQKSALLENQLIYGGYPYLQNLSDTNEKKLYLKSIVEDYLFKDVLLLKDIAQPDVLRKLAILLAFQVGNEVSLNELSKSLGIDVKTVSKYILLLKQGFIIFEIGAYSTNLRKEIAKGKKYYFWDLGIRNAITEQYFDLKSRPDLGSLWENFLILERLKKQEYKMQIVQNYFWRTYEQAEIDWIEFADNQLSAYEFKYSPKPNKTPKAFFDSYKTTVIQINKDNYLDFIS